MSQIIQNGQTIKKKVENIVQVEYWKMFKSITGKERKNKLLITLKTDKNW